MRGMIRAQIPARFGKLPPKDNQGRNLFNAKQLNFTFAQAQAVMAEYRKRQADPATHTAVIQE